MSYLRVSMISVGILDPVIFYPVFKVTVVQKQLISNFDIE